MLMTWSPVNAFRGEACDDLLHCGIEETERGDRSDLVAAADVDDGVALARLAAGVAPVLRRTLLCWLAAAMSGARSSTSVLQPGIPRPRTDIAVKLAQALNVSAAYLFSTTWRSRAMGWSQWSGKADGSAEREGQPTRYDANSAKSVGGIFLMVCDSNHRGMLL